MKTIIIILLLALSLTSPTNAYAQKKPVSVFAVNVERKPFVDEIEALGTLQANENVELASTVLELVTKVNFDDGARVKKGDVLVEMDVSEELALKAEEQFRLKEAQRQVKRLEPLIKRGAASKAALDEQQVEMQASQARMKAIESQIQQRKIIAPFDGVVGQRNISVGALAQPGMLITTIDDDSAMKLDFAVPEIFLSALEKGVKVKASTRAWPDDVFTGTIYSINSRIDPLTRSVSVRALLPNADYKLRPGLLMRVQLQKDPRLALVIPEEALVTKGNENHVMVAVKEGDKTIVKDSVVKIGTRRKGDVEIIEGLEEGAHIITHGTLRVSAGAEVIVKVIANDNASLTDMLNQQPEPQQSNTEASQ
ncbi:MAG: efflux RND transporter periplasmic adaptor subunit [Alphaproteobacteria bacterium]|nr:efflux RND transporter periplasmic adaptor subunit [Alphaproteobacteria bacterium]